MAFDLSLMAQAAKVAFSRSMAHVPKTRSGRRSARVTTLLKREGEGTLYKKAMFDACYDSLEKLGEAPSAYEAQQALRRLRKLERERPTAQQLSRGAITGAIVGPGALLASKMVAGGMGSSLRQATKAKTVGGKALGVGKALWGGGRQLGGSAASGAVFGAGLPSVRSHLDREAEKQKLRDYLEMSGGGRYGKIRGSVRRKIGV